MNGSGPKTARAEAALSAWRIALAGALALAAAVGIGRFAFTPILPMMQEDAGLTVARGGWLATANYAGYLVGALWVMAHRVRPKNAIRYALVAIAFATLAMGWAENLLAWLVLRAAAGVASAWGLIHTSAWCIERLSQLRRPLLDGAVFAGVGVGMTVAGTSCLALMHYGAGSRDAWLVLGAVCLALSVATWRVLGVGAPAPPPRKTLRHGFRWTPDAVRLVLCYGATGVGYIIPATFLPAMARDTIQDPAVFGWAWPVFGLAAASSTLFAAPLLNALGNRGVWILGASIMALGVAFPLLVSGILGIVMAATLVGVSFMVTTMVGIREARAVATEAAPTLVAAFTAAFAVGQILGPILVSSLVIRFGTIAPALVVAVAVLVASIVALAVHRPAMTA